jgi:cell division protease FtsH
VRRLLRSPGIYVVLILLALVLALSFQNAAKPPTKISFDQMMRDADAHKIADVTLVDGPNIAKVTYTASAGGQKVETHYPASASGDLLFRLTNDSVKVTSTVHHTNIFISLLVNFLPFLLIIGVFLFFMNAMQGGGNRVMQFGKARPKLASKDQPKVTFADVAGADEAVAELQEIKEFLEAPAKFQAMGAKIPKGVLLFGPPGTGKTLLARAVAGEAGVPFFSISGSDFVEMFVGVGASRVRDLFEQAKTNAPAIVFVDEIDAVGRHRGAGLGGGHDEREQTLNQLLVEMDGFDVKTGVILIAATNRPDILDPALLRPGRFDRQIVVDRPDLEGRRAILRVHANGKPLDETVNLDVLARRTPGFTGADLANLMNEAALLTARFNKRQIGMIELEEAIDRVIAGPERKTRVISAKEKERIAYHEGGHTIVGHVLPMADPVHKVSIVSRGRALGWTLQLPTEDKYNNSRSELLATMAVLMGGRTAEEIVFGEQTTGASDDIERATNIARRMVTEFGMSDTIGPIRLGQAEHEVFLGRDYGQQANYSDEVAARIDAEVRVLIDQAHREAEAILREHRATLDRLAVALVDKETLDQDDLAGLLGDLPDWSRQAPAHPVRTPDKVGPPDQDPGSPVPVSTPVPVGAGLRRLLRRSPSKPATA